MPVSLNFHFCVRCYEPHKKPRSYYIHVTKERIFQIDCYFHFLFKINFSCSGVGATISDAVARSSIVFCNSVSADRIVMAASRLLRAVAAFVILLSSAAGLRKLHEGCHSDLSADFLHFGVSDFPSKNSLKSASKSSCTITVRGWTTKSGTTKFSADNTFISGKLCGPLNQSLLMLRWSADKVLPQRDQLSFDCRGWVCVVMNRIRIWIAVLQ